jgi:hypothetical protein
VGAAWTVEPASSGRGVIVGGAGLLVVGVRCHWPLGVEGVATCQ